MPDFFETLTKRRADAIAKLDADTFAPAIRNHLLQLYRAAHAVEPTLTGIKTGMGGATPCGEYVKQYDDGETLTESATQWHAECMAQPKHSETRDFFAAVAAYSDAFMTLPDVGDIAPADLVTGRAKKAAIHGPRGLRARLSRR